jgi:hypothetical protein
MTLITGLLVIDFASQRAIRNVVLAKNETATNIRKVQSYMLSSRNISANLPAKYYMLTFTKSNTYKVQAIDNAYVFHDNIEVITLPTSVTVSNLQIGSTSYECLQIIYSAPFGNMYVYGSSTPSDCGASVISKLRDPVQLASMSQSASYVIFSGLANDPAGKYIQISPLTGQVISH